MKYMKAGFVGPLLVFGAFAGWTAATHLVAHADDGHPKTPMAITELAKKRGPKPPSGSTFVGTEAHPMVGDLGLPIQNAEVYTFNVKTQSGATVPVKWAYTPGTGTFLWATAPVDCGDGNTIARAGFVMKIHDDGTGAYVLGTRQCPVAAAYGCGFDAHQKDTQCGACAWNGTELVCAKE